MARYYPYTKKYTRLVKLSEWVLKRAESLKTTADFYQAQADTLKAKGDPIGASVASMKVDFYRDEAVTLLIALRSYDL